MKGSKVEFIIVCPYNHCYYCDKVQVDFNCINCDKSVVRKDKIIESYDNNHTECVECANIYWK